MTMDQTKRKVYSYIRFSTPDQLKGDSYRRQEEESIKYCKEKGLTLDKKLSFKDLGTSAFHGAHRKTGELGHFLQLVDKGKVPEGSILIVENLDRLSRENVMTAFDQFRAIVSRGITIVTLMDKMEYSSESIEQNWTQLIISITYMAKAYKESKDKSERIKKAWVEKRKKIDKIKLTSRAPAWLRLSEDKTHFIPDNLASQTIEHIFRMKLDGIGVESIARRLNSRQDVWKPPHYNKRMTGEWRQSYINKILRSRAVLGEYTPCTYTNGKRYPELPIEDYYPAIISEELFYLVQDYLRKKAEEIGHLGGKTGKMGNLFTHVVKCGYCGSPMHLVDKGKSSKGGQYLHCDASRRKISRTGCKAKMVRYDEFEQLFFERFDDESKIILSDIVPNRSEREVEKSRLKSLITAYTTQIEERQDRIKELVEHISKKSSEKTKELYETEVRHHINKCEELEKLNKPLKIKLTDLENEVEDRNEQARQITSLYELLNSVTNEEERIDIRIRLNIEIMKMFEWLRIYPLEEPYEKYKEIEPGIVQIMHSKHIDKITYKLKDLDLPKGIKSHGVILVKTTVDIGPNSLSDFVKSF